MKIENLSPRTSDLTNASHDVASLQNARPQARPAKKDRNSTFQAKPAPFNFIRALPRDILNTILDKLDDSSQQALSCTEKASLKLYGEFLSKGYYRLINNIFKVKPDQRHQDLFNEINKELQRHKIIDLSPGDKFSINQFFEKHVFTQQIAEDQTLLRSATRTGASITARHLVTGIERKYFPRDVHVQAQQNLDDFTVTFSRHGLADSRNIAQFLRSARTLPHPEVFISKLYRAVQHASDTPAATALTNFLATLGHWFSKTSPEEFIGTPTPQVLLQELKILRDMLHAATPVAAQLGNHSLSEHLSHTQYTRENALIAIQWEIEQAIRRVEAHRPTSLPARMGHFLKSRFS